MDGHHAGAGQPEPADRTPPTGRLATLIATDLLFSPQWGTTPHQNPTRRMAEVYLAAVRMYACCEGL
jgi:hypothetical protein